MFAGVPVPPRNNRATRQNAFALVRGFLGCEALLTTRTMNHDMTAIRLAEVFSVTVKKLLVQHQSDIELGYLPVISRSA